MEGKLFFLPCTSIFLPKFLKILFLGITYSKVQKSQGICVYLPTRVHARPDEELPCFGDTSLPGKPPPVSNPQRGSAPFWPLSPASGSAQLWFSSKCSYITGYALFCVRFIHTTWRLHSFCSYTLGAITSSCLLHCSCVLVFSPFYFLTFIHSLTK